MKYTDQQKQEVFNEWLQGMLNNAKKSAILANADNVEFSCGTSMNADDEFTADFKIVLTRKGAKK
jgi:hypothetical protein